MPEYQKISRALLSAEASTTFYTAGTYTLSPINISNYLNKNASFGTFVVASGTVIHQGAWNASTTFWSQIGSPVSINTSGGTYTADQTFTAPYYYYRLVFNCTGTSAIFLFLNAQT